jgi:hypothetical protein
MPAAQSRHPPEGMQYDKGWQNALVAFDHAEFYPGDIIPMSWFYDHFRVRDLPADASCTVGEYQKERLIFMGQMERFQKALAEDYDLILQNVRGQGYRIIPPSEQTGWTMDQGQKEMTKALNKIHMRLTHIRIGELTDEERRQNADAQAKLAALRSGARKTLV